MTTEYQRRLKITTPVGRAHYCWIQTPSTLHEPDGVYQTDIHCQAGELDTIRASLTEFAEAYRVKEDVPMLTKKVKGEKVKVDMPITLPLHPSLDDCDEPTGEEFIRTKLPAVFRRKAKPGQEAPPPTHNTVTIVNGAGDPMEPRPPVGDGSMLRAACVARCSYVAAKKTIFVSLDLKVVQIHTLVDFNEARAKREAVELMSGLGKLDGAQDLTGPASGPASMTSTGPTVVAEGDVAF